MESTPEGSGKTELDAPEGMAVADGLIFVVDTANSRINAFDIDTIQRVSTYPPAWWGTAGRNRQGKGGDQLDNPQDVAAHEGEIFVSDTHNDRIQVFSTQLQWIGVIGCHGTSAGEFIYPRGLTVARELLYVCEQERIQVLTLLGEPRVVLPVPGAMSLCGIVCDHEGRVYCTDMDAHVLHVLRFTHDERWQEDRRKAIHEAKMRRWLRGGGGGDGRRRRQRRRRRRQL